MTNSIVKSLIKTKFDTYGHGVPQGPILEPIHFLVLNQTKRMLNLARYCFLNRSVRLKS